MTEFPRTRVPHVRDSFIVAKPGSPPACWWGGNVGIVRGTTVPAHLHPPETSKVEVSLLMPALPRIRVPHLRDSFIVAKVGIVRRTTAPAHLHRPETSNLEVES
jgi:hypothetical protein